MTINAGVLALQGDIEEHVYAFKNAFEELGVKYRIVLVKKPEHLEQIDCISIPGGESTTIGVLSRRTGILDKLREKILNGLPVFGTCAGMIMLAKEVKDAVVGETGQPILGVMNISVIRNVFGRQRESFEVDLKIPEIDEKPIRAVFIRAPAAIRCWGNARPLASVKHVKFGDLIVMAREEHILAAAFHPELTKDTRVFKYFIQKVAKLV